MQQTMDNCGGANQVRSVSIRPDPLGISCANRPPKLARRAKCTFPLTLEVHSTWQVHVPAHARGALDVASARPGSRTRGTRGGKCMSPLTHEVHSTWQVTFVRHWMGFMGRWVGASVFVSIGSRREARRFVSVGRGKALADRLRGCPVHD